MICWRSHDQLVQLSFCTVQITTTRSPKPNQQLTQISQAGAVADCHHKLAMCLSVYVVKNFWTLRISPLVESSAAAIDECLILCGLISFLIPAFPQHFNIINHRLTVISGLHGRVYLLEYRNRKSQQPARTFLKRSTSMPVGSR